MSDTLTITGRKYTKIDEGDTVECVKSNLYAVIGTTAIVSKETKAFYSLMIGNGYFQVVPKKMKKTKLYIPSRPTHPEGLEQVTSTFPLGESYVKLIGDMPETVDVHFRYSGDASLFLLANFVNALRIKGVKTINLFCPYFPGCRSDRVNDDNQGEALSSKVYAQFVNSMNFGAVTIFDPHSDVTVVVLDRVRPVSNVQFVKSILDSFTQDFIFVTPDAGANKKVDSMAKKVGKGKVIRADKKRDVETGSLVPGACTVFSTADELKGKVCVIVDDICSRGGTFKTLAAELKKLGAAEIICIFSHYENTADQKSLQDSGITKIFTTNSLIECSEANEFLNIIDIEPFLSK